MTADKDDRIAKCLNRAAGDHRCLEAILNKAEHHIKNSKTKEARTIRKKYLANSVLSDTRLCI
jgi:hypothetical protein